MRAISKIILFFSYNCLHCQKYLVLFALLYRYQKMLSRNVCNICQKCRGTEHFRNIYVTCGLKLQTNHITAPLSIFQVLFFLFIPSIILCFNFVHPRITSSYVYPYIYHLDNIYFLHFDQMQRLQISYKGMILEKSSLNLLENFKKGYCLACAYVQAVHGRISESEQFGEISKLWRLSSTAMLAKVWNLHLVPTQVGLFRLGSKTLYKRINLALARLWW